MEALEAFWRTRKDGAPGVDGQTFQDYEANLATNLRALLDQALAAPDSVFGGRADVLHDGVEAQPEWSAADVAAERRSLGLPKNRPIVAMTGQVAEVKGVAPARPLLEPRVRPYQR